MISSSARIAIFWTRYLASRTREPVWTRAIKGSSRALVANTIILAGVRGTFDGLCLAKLPRKTNSTGARESSNLIDACSSIQALIGLTIIDVDGAVFASPSIAAIASKVIDPVNTAIGVLARRRGAIVNVDLAKLACKSNSTLTTPIS